MLSQRIRKVALINTRRLRSVWLPNRSSNQLNVEDHLLTQTDPIANVQKNYNPSVIRAFKNSRETPIKQGYMQELVSCTENLLLFLNCQSDKRTASKLYLPFHLTKATNHASIHAVQAFREVRSDKELAIFSSCLAILKPSSPVIWSELDTAIGSRINEFGIEPIALFAHAIMTASREYKFQRIRFKTPSAVLKAILTHNTGFLEIDTDKSGSESPLSLNENRVTDNRLIEHVALFLDMLTFVSSQDSSQVKGLLEQATISAQGALRGAVNPIKFNTLKLIWLTAPHLRLPNSYNMYKALYDQVLYSIAAQPLQIVNELEAVTTLLESMIASKFRHAKLVTEICKIMTERGMRSDKYGMRMFTALIELDAVPFAMTLLQSIIDSANSYNADLQFGGQKGAASELSVDAKCRIHETLLSVKSNYKPAHLVLAMCSFGRGATSQQFDTLLVIEQDILGQLKQGTINVHEVVSIQHCYGLSGRNQPDVIAQLDRILGENYSKLNLRQISRLLYANARLNHKAAYTSEISALLFDHLKKLSGINVDTVVQLTRAMWALAVVECLTVEQFKHLERALLSRNSLTKSMRTITLFQLMQATLEVRLKNPGNEEIAGERAWEVSWKQASVISAEGTSRSSSLSHKDASKMLNAMGIYHENEKRLPCGYIIDMFIPNNVDKGSKVPGCMGTILEFDGPTHYETYMNKPLGPTSMKRRHLLQLGYDFRSMSYLQYKLEFTTEQKQLILRKVLNK